MHTLTCMHTHARTHTHLISSCTDCLHYPLLQAVTLVDQSTGLLQIAKGNNDWKLQQQA